MAIRLNTLQKYAKEVYERPNIQNYLEVNTKKFPYTKVKDWYPILYESGTCGVETAGQIWLNPNGKEEPILEMSSWIMVDRNQAKRVVRHEIAHILQFVCELNTENWHGSGFGEALRIVSPTLHKYSERSDRGWHTNSNIEKERRKYHRLKKTDGSDKLSAKRGGSTE